jgi:hypothetical protein
MDIRFQSARNVSTVDTTTSTNSASRAATEAPDLLPGTKALMCSGDPGAMLAALTMDTANNEEKAARAQRDACEKAQHNAEAAEIKDLRQKADLTRIQGLVSGAFQIGQAAMSFTSSMKGLAADNLNDNATEASNDAKAEREMVSDYGNGVNDEQKAAMNGYAQARDNDAIAFKSESRGVQQTASNYKGVGDLCGATKTMVDGLFNGAIVDKDTDAKAHEMAAQSFKAMASDAHDNENDAKALLNKALDFYKEYVDTKNQTAMAATHRA